ncbi:hypothetical protein E2C01_097077 [Portunus trituberculatus]|uniref:Uncharacterized protein n=1 Tax=Portunus trituberculatus TaxID=210409 RepID=A0A5B7JZH5_PORTR|nr:hypothetical protein [Portunus trituberculatus]
MTPPASSQTSYSKISIYKTLPTLTHTYSHLPTPCLNNAHGGSQVCPRPKPTSDTAPVKKEIPAEERAARGV